MALKTNDEMLEEIQAAISAVLLSQSYNVNGQSVTRADLKNLQEMESYYEQKKTRADNSNPQYLGSFDRADI